MSSTLGRCGRYELLRFIDVGGMGEVFLARGPSPRGEADIVALKRLLPQIAQDRAAVNMFMDEAHIASQLRHPNIARVYHASRSADSHFIVMEHVDGLSLRMLVRRSASVGPIPWAVAARIIADAARGLDHAHALTDAEGRSYGLVHRDVSPANIMVGYDGVTRLLDFGLAKARTQIEKTKPGLVKGKFAYLAPEQLKSQVSPRVDVFGLGLCLWEALSGRQLFGEGNAAETMVQIQQHRGAPSLRALRKDVPEAIDAVLSRALDPDPDGRYGSAGEMAGALDALLRRSSPDVAAWMAEAHPRKEEDAPPEPGPVPSPVAHLVDAPPPRRSGLGIAIAVLALLTAAAAAAALFGLL